MTGWDGEPNAEVQRRRISREIDGCAFVLFVSRWEINDDLVFQNV